MADQLNTTRREKDEDSEDSEEEDLPPLESEEESEESHETDDVLMQMIIERETLRYHHRQFIQHEIEMGRFPESDDD